MDLILESHTGQRRLSSRIIGRIHDPHPITRHLGSKFFLHRKGRPYMSVWDGSTTSLAAWRAPVKPRHFGVGAGFVDEDEALRVEIDLPFEPVLSRGIYIAAPLLGGVRCLF